MELIEIGQIVNAHGIHGEVKLNPWTDSIGDLLELEVFYFRQGEALHVRQSRIHKNCVIIRFEEVADRNAAERMKGTILFTEKTELPEGRYYIADLLGLDVYEGNKRLGVVRDIFATGANDVYDIKTAEGKSILIPAIDGVLLSIDTDNKRISVRLPEGLLDAEAEV